MSSGPQPGTAPATQHSQAGSASGQAYGQHGYSEPAKPKKGQQLWNRMKREWPWAAEGRGPHRTPGARHVGCLDLASLLGPPGAVRGAARNGRPSLELRAPAPGVGAGPPTWAGEASPQLSLPSQRPLGLVGSSSTFRNGLSLSQARALAPPRRASTAASVPSPTPRRPRTTGDGRPLARPQPLGTVLSICVRPTGTACSLESREPPCPTGSP